MTEPLEYLFDVELADGTKLVNLEKYGDTFIAVNDVDESIFEFNTSPVKVTKRPIHGGTDENPVEETTYPAMQLGFVRGKEFGLTPVPEIDQIHSRFESQVQYLAMMTDVDLEEM